jgi:hypothetical protein
MRTVTVYKCVNIDTDVDIDVDVEMSDFDDDDLQEELEERGLGGLALSKDDLARLTEAMEIAKFKDSDWRLYQKLNGNIFK